MTSLGNGFATASMAAMAPGAGKADLLVSGRLFKVRFSGSSAPTACRIGQPMFDVAQTGRPVLLERGLSTTIDEWLLSAEYLLAGGNPRVILCERGVRGFEAASRPTLDRSALW